jgi:hypothetical protein
MSSRTQLRPAVVLCLVMCLSVVHAGCFVRKRVLTPPQGAPANRPILTATKDELLQRIHSTFDPILNFSMRADMSPSVGSVYTGALTDYATIRAYVLFGRPSEMRVIGLDPVVHSSTIFDMVSSGNDYRVSIPSRNEFIEGDNNAPPSSKNKLENLRPAAFLQSMIVEPPEPGELTLLEDDTDETKAVYIVLMLRQDPAGLHLIRTVFFNRYTLEIARQKTFDEQGAIVSETHYSEWKPFGGINFPSVIVIRRPLDGYEVTMDVLDLKVNSPEVMPDKFVLEQPAGSHLTRLK